MSRKASHQPPELDPVIHPINRLKICATLFSAGATEGRQMKYGQLAELTELPADTLSKQLKHLGDHGYVSRTREYGSTRAKDAVWVTLTEAGAQAYAQHVEALKAMTEGL
ncbi:MULTISPECIES: transcriptional regulator [Corynebacterium]|uniref:Transcriptional regulator n=1 Tax=Corynebacterium hesseae TaxID=2913502 RepID=A0ABU9UIY4_9CORY|nr:MULTISPECIES: transcriptional regulator [Corynebacterium]MCZ9297734.1 transcriptional regulator [Corynebacterium hesseae]MTD97241.1 MarR family transcriptional regulator [Corynebacterium guaraldiae]PKZ24659.1 MarR family transcriptional regulator [Corynebacterium aurimucosum]TRX39918.1 MarR family transcriptional regulator [Corynebacterium guaraldiae]